MRKKILRFQLIIGMGFFSVVLGSVGSAWIFTQPASSRLPAWASLLIPRLWIVVVLPSVVFGMSRLVPLNRWRTALGAGLAGEAFLLLLMIVAPPPALTHSAQAWMIGVRLLTFVLGVILAGWVI